MISGEEEEEEGRREGHAFYLEPVCWRLDCSQQGGVVCLPCWIAACLEHHRPGGLPQQLLLSLGVKWKCHSSRMHREMLVFEATLDLHRQLVNLAPKTHGRRTKVIMAAVASRVATERPQTAPPRGSQNSSL